MSKLTTRFATATMAGFMALSMLGCGVYAKSNRTTAEAATQYNCMKTEDTENTKQMAKDFKKLMNDVMEETVEDAAKEMEDFVSKYADKISYHSLEAAAADNFAAMLEENENNDFSAPYELKMEVIDQQCLEDNPDLETDTAYCNVVNAINNQLAVMQESLNK